MSSLTYHTRFETSEFNLTNPTHILQNELNSIKTQKETFSHLWLFLKTYLYFSLSYSLDCVGIVLYVISKYDCLI